MSKTLLSVVPANVAQTNRIDACKATAGAGVSDKLCATCQMVLVISLGLLLGTEAPVITRNCVDFSFSFSFISFPSGQLQ